MVFKSSYNCKAKFHLSPFTSDDSLKTLLPLMTVVNEMWSNHSGPAKHRREPNDTLSCNTFNQGPINSTGSPVFLCTYAAACKVEEILIAKVICIYLYTFLCFIHNIAMPE